MTFAKQIVHWALGALCLVGASSTWAGPHIQSWQTSNGAQVLFVQSPELPILDVQVVFDAGSARDETTPGLAALTNGMLSQGAGGWGADQIAERLAEVGAKLGDGSLRDMAWLSLRTLTSEPALGVAMETLATLLARPSFAEEAFERERRSTLVALRQAEQDPGSVGMKALYRQIYGRHPYANDPLGTEASVKALTAGTLRTFHQRYYVAANAVVAMVGDLSRAQAEALAEQLVGALPRGTHAEPLPPVSELSQGSTEHLEFPSTQTHVYAGQPGMQRVDPDYFPLYVGNHILGGSGLVSLLSDEVREKRGLSYSVYSHFLPMSAPGPFVLGLQTKNSQAVEAQGVLLETLTRFTASGPTEEELRAAKLNLTGGFPLRIANNGKILQNLAAIGFYRLPLDYLDRFKERVEAVTAAEIRDAFQRRIDPTRLAVVIVGPEQDKRVARAGD